MRIPGEGIDEASLLPELPEAGHFNNSVIAEVTALYWRDPQYVYLEDALLPALKEMEPKVLFEARDWFKEFTRQETEHGFETTVVDEIFHRRPISYIVTEEGMILSQLGSLASFKKDLVSELADYDRFCPDGELVFQDELENELYSAVYKTGRDWDVFVSMLRSEEERRSELALTPTSETHPNQGELFAV